MGIVPDLEHRAATPNLLARYSVRTIPRIPGTGPECDLTRERLIGGFSWEERVTSTAQINVALDDASCCDCIPEFWRDELIIERLTPEGRSEGIVWRGTVTNVQQDTSATPPRLRISAADNSVWWTRRDRLRESIVGTLDEAELWLQLVRDAEAGGASGLVIPNASTPTSLFSTIDLVGASASTAGALNTNLIFGGLANVWWTVVDRTLYGPGPVPNEPMHETLDVDRHWIGEGAVVERDGTAVASQVRLIFRDPDDSNTVVIGEWPPTPVIDPVYGLHIQTYLVLAEATSTELIAQAARRYEQDRYGHTFLVTSEDSLAAAAPVTIWDLRPGRTFIVNSQSTCEQIVGLPMRTYNVSVDFESSNGEIIETRVAPDFGPVGSLARSTNRISV